ncbi:MAG: hypothetical protein ACE5K2_09150 [Candidatus Zixiibacteriota bacterium]
MKQTTKNFHVDQLHTKLLYLGLVLDFFVPAVLFSLGLFLRSQGVGTKPLDGLDILLWVLLAVSVVEVLAIYLIKKKISPAQNMPRDKEQSILLKQMFLRSGLILFSLSLSPTVYGFIYFLLGGMVERFVLFIAITLLCFLLFKPKLEEMKSLRNALFDPSNNH